MLNYELTTLTSELKLLMGCYLNVFLSDSSVHLALVTDTTTDADQASIYATPFRQYSMPKYAFSGNKLARNTFKLHSVLYVLMARAHPKLMEF